MTGIKTYLSDSDSKKALIIRFIFLFVTQSQCHRSLEYLTQLTPQENQKNLSVGLEVLALVCLFSVTYKYIEVTETKTLLLAHYLPTNILRLHFHLKP